MPAFRLRRLVRGTAVAMALVVAPAAADPTTQRDVRGVVTPESAATISSDLNARVVAMPFRTGQSFRRGDDLLRFDCGRYEADLRAAEAEVRMTLQVRDLAHLSRVPDIVSQLPNVFEARRTG